MSSSVPSERELSRPPSDGITANKFAHLSDLLVVSSWDKGVRLYDVTKDHLLLTYEHKGSVLDCCFSADDSMLFSAGIDRNLIMMDVKSERQTTLGSHDQPIKCVDWHFNSGLVVTGSWDCSISLWDYKSRKPTVSTVNCSNKVYTLSSTEDKIVVGTSNRHVYVYDVRNLVNPIQHRESSLMHQTRCIRCFPDGTGFALSSIEGRVAIEYFDSSSQVQKKKYAFKCHRKPVGKTQILYPVNAIAFHPQYFGTFATGGCDGQIYTWDGANQKRIHGYPVYPTSIAYLDFNRNGTLLAIASSYTFEEGEKDHPPDSIFIRTVNESEIKLKATKTK